MEVALSPADKILSYSRNARELPIETLDDSASSVKDARRQLIIVRSESDNEQRRQSPGTYAVSNGVARELIATTADANAGGLLPSDECALRNIRCRAGELIRDRYLRQDELGDFTHDLFCEYLQRMRHYDPSRGSRATYIGHIVRNQTATWLARRRREQPAILPLEWEAENQIDAKHDENALIQRLTIQSIVQDLPIHQQVLVRHLSERSVTSASELMGKSRTWVYGQIAEIRLAFERKGFSRPCREAQPVPDAARGRRMA